MEDLPQILPVPNKQKDRFKKLTTSFKSKYGVDPTFFARAPGRVNLIGEHIDYCGYAVLPMAIEQDIVIACAPSAEPEIQLANMNSRYEFFKCSTSNVTIDMSNPTWYNYFLCGYRGIMEHLNKSELKGMLLMVDGTVPCSSGLSSSSALVCCSALTSMYVNGCSMLTKLELADIAVRCEKYIGTQGGGMDQSISFLAQAGTAKLIEFNPIRATDVQLPQDVVFVISNSCIENNKAATATYNIRVVECRLACQIIAKSKGLHWREIKWLGDLQKALGVSLKDILVIVNDILHTEPYTKDEVCDVLGVTTDELNKNSLSQNTLDVQSFKLYQRATHVFGEADRVLQFQAVCNEQPQDAVTQLGTLMNASHSSCRDMYECSCTELDELVDICIKSGAIGSRLTGAGWGGCAVSLVRANQVTEFIQQVHAGYYKKDSSLEAKAKESLFATEPGSGASIYTI